MRPHDDELDDEIRGHLARSVKECLDRARFFERVPLPVFAAAVILVSAAALASLIPAARASRVDVLQALRSE